MKSTDGAPLQSVSVYRFSPPGAHKGRDLRLWKLETTNEVRRGSPLVLARNPLHECIRTEGEWTDVIVYGARWGIRSTEISQRVKPLKCSFKSDTMAFSQAQTRLIMAHRCRVRETYAYDTGDSAI